MMCLFTIAVPTIVGAIIWKVTGNIWFGILIAGAMSVVMEKVIYE